MLARLGSAIYWLGCGVAVITVVSGSKLWLEKGNEFVGIVILYWIMAGGVWFIGCAFRYVLRKLVW